MLPMSILILGSVSGLVLVYQRFTSPQPQKPHMTNTYILMTLPPLGNHFMLLVSYQDRCSALSVRDEHKFTGLLSRPYSDHSSDTKDNGVHYMITYKEAAHETQWEMEEASQLRHLCQYIHVKEKELLNVKAEEVKTFVNMLVDHMDDQVTNDLDKDLDTLEEHVFRTSALKLLSGNSSEDQSSSEINGGDEKHRANGG
ncbi:hypothetical protein BDR07DRAFT_1374755 [Suillus spraguei]|nr:hypothetical protein BDR07DRAFT_1374755 [Suillus spraguei]